ncbi:MAG TPA: transcriptional repressor [Solirubrobacteraceae bacterium]|nr:transcriptional repressor [Solirubrobacteraceae bacterium]
MQTEDVAQLLRAHDLRVTPQRRAILQAFRGRGDEHLSAEEVLARASAAVPEIGRGTVYATLAELAEMGLLSAFGNQDVIRYETNLEPHDHFRCRVCLRIFDVEFGGEELRGRPLEGFVVEHVLVMARGICGSCMDYHRGLADGAESMLSRAIVAEDAVDELAAVVVPSPLGDLIAAASNEGIARVAFTEHADYATLTALCGGRRRRSRAAAREHLAALTGSIDGYFGGEHMNAVDEIDWRFFQPAARLALTAVRQIAWATTLSYDRLGDGFTPYECGLAIGSNPTPILIPCHRVTRGAEIAELYVGGLEHLRYLQQFEVAG